MVRELKKKEAKTFPLLLGNNINHRITNLQMYRMILKGSTLWRSSSPTQFLKQDYLDHDAQDHAQFILVYLRGWVSHNCFKKSASVSNPPHG